jgi:hypothetical protein
MEKMDREELEQQVQEMSVTQILDAVVASEFMCYYQSDDPDIQKANIRNMCEVADRIVKFKEIDVVENKTEQEQETKLKMNENDNKAKVECVIRENETKLQIAKMEKATADAKMAIEGCEGVVDILAGAGKALGAVALTGLLVNWECEGYVPGKSGAFRLMSDLAKTMIKK